MTKFKIFSFIQSQYDKTSWYDWIWFWLKIEICLNFGVIMPFFRGFCFAPSYLLAHFYYAKPFLPNRYAIFDSLQWRADKDWKQINFALVCHAKFTHTFLLAMVIFWDIKLFILCFFWIFIAPKFAFKSMSKKMQSLWFTKLKINPKISFAKNKINASKSL